MPPGIRRPIAGAALLLAGILAPGVSRAQTPGDPIQIQRAAGAIAVDGDLEDEGWKGAARIEKWYEINPGDNIEPGVKNVAYLSYDDRYFYAAFEFFDPEAKLIRAPYGDRDSVNSAMDFGGIVLSTNGDGKTAVEFFANPRGIQYDAIQSDVSGEDPSPDYFWDSAGRVHEDRWTLEIRIPFSSLRYPAQPVQKWGVLLYRNYPRDRRYQIFSARLPREVSCFICNSTPIVGLEGLPHAGGFVIAPYGTARRESVAENGPGTPLVEGDPEYDGGVDAKWTPSEHTALDATLNPDFSQIESDVAVISTNERFAIFLPEKRPFFLEGKDLFSTPINAVYTRTLNDPRWGARATGKAGATSYTALLVDDQGGGLVILPGPNNSQFVPEDFSSLNVIARGRRDFGQSFGSFLLTDREIDGGGYNRVFGPDFQWRPNAQDWVTGQFLYSESETPDRPDLAAEWDGSTLSGHAGTLQWFLGTATYDLTLLANDIADGFRADLGFLPQAGIREGYGEYGYTIHPTGFLSRVRTFVGADYTADREGNLVFQQVAPGMGMDGRGNSFMRYRVLMERVEAGNGPIGRTRLEYTLRASLSRVFNKLELTGWVGEQIDFANSRPGHGAQVSLNGTFRPTDHLELVLNTDYRFLNVEGGQRLFTAQVERLKATYTFSQRSFLRLIGQHARTDRDPDLYTFVVPAHDGSLSASALYAYKLNWQTVFYAGFGDEKALTDQREYEPDARSLFLKLSYAFQP